VRRRREASREIACAGYGGSCKGLISFGVAGGLAPGLRPGTCIIGSSVIDEGEERLTDARWSQRLRRIIPDTQYGPLLGVRQPIALADDKSALHEKTGALAVDMESHVVARAAARHGVPLAAIRVVVDPVERTIPRSALAGTRPDGTIDPLAVARSLMRHPRDLVGLVRMSLDARAARATLVQGSALLGPGLGLLDSAPRPAIALALEATQADAV
jgi:hopanoid-associated phosphorylase